MQPALAALDVALVEQPLPAADDAALEGFESAVPICADESCHVAADLPRLQGRYQAINIKLDKTGGLTEALALRTEARARGFRIMRSEERRAGKACGGTWRSRWSPDHAKKKQSDMC